MGGRGSRSTRSGGATIRISAGGVNPQQQQPQQSIANQPPTPSNTPITPGGVDVISQMSDDQLANLVNNSRRVDMPNHLSDVSDRTQKLVYAAGLNEKPMVVDQAGFDAFRQQNGISRNQIMARTMGGADYVVSGTRIQLTPGQVSSLIRDGELNYVGGKHGGKVHGAGTYFDMNGGHSTGYGSGRTVTAIAVLNPAKARVIDDYALSQRSSAFARSHPKFAKAVGSYTSDTKSIYAIAQGYNVIKSGSYHNVIDRSALVMLNKDI